MTNHDGQDSQPDRRVTRDVPGESIDYRQPEDEDGVFEVRMPIATTGEVRNQGDEPLTRDELSGMARQIDAGGVPVFLDHGASELGGRSRYSAVEKVGEWTDAEVSGRESDDLDELVATARMMDPETLPSAASSIREALASIKEQVKRDLSLSSSIGWREDDSAPGGNDLMEASIVGIGADPRTTSDASAATVARAAVEAGADPDALVDAVRSAVTPEDRHDMTDDTDESADDADTEQNDEPDELRDAPEWASRLLEMQEQQTETLRAVADALREDDEGDDEDDEEDQESDESDEDEDEDEQSADAEDAERVAELEDELDSLRSELDSLREGGLSADDVDTPDPDDEQSADDPNRADESQTTSTRDKWVR